ncbi:MAG: hypothetical protein AABY91_03820, partial [Gemmatimonadota bacterium]
VAWAASFLGAWLGAEAAGRLKGSTGGLWATVIGGAVFAIGATVAWIWLLRRSPELREQLGVTEEGVPVVAVELVERAGEALTEKTEDSA